jgi:hypothetical protein
MNPAHGGDGLCIICRAPIQTYEVSTLQTDVTPHIASLAPHARAQNLVQRVTDCALSPKYVKSGGSGS